MHVSLHCRNRDVDGANPSGGTIFFLFDINVNEFLKNIPIIRDLLSYKLSEFQEYLKNNPFDSFFQRGSEEEDKEQRVIKWFFHFKKRLAIA